MRTKNTQSRMCATCIAIYATIAIHIVLLGGGALGLIGSPLRRALVPWVVAAALAFAAAGLLSRLIRRKPRRRDVEPCPYG
jgi:hypothetical protein